MFKKTDILLAYIRLSGIDESGATESLRFIPTEEAVMEKVVNLYDYTEKP